MNDPPRRTRGALNHLWFWSFWHWSVESFRGGSLLHDPVHGLASHWDEWFRHEASADERRSIARAGATERSQRAFVVWLARCWCREVELGGAPVPPAFALGQLADVPPFRDWPAFARYRSTYGAEGVSAIVLAEGSDGEPTDVRAVEAIMLPPDAEGTASAFIAEGFHASEVDLEVSRQAAMSVLAGPGLASLLARWLASGRRPYPRTLAVALALGWLAVAGMIVWLLIGPDPGVRLVPLGATLTALWCTLSLVALTTATVVVVRGWREGHRWRARLETSQVRLRVNGGLTLRGGSAGLPFCLDTLLATYRAESRARTPTWLWSQAIGGLQAHAGGWAATGVVTASGQIKPVMLEAKIRAVRQTAGVRAMLVPRQRHAQGLASPISIEVQAAHGVAGRATPARSPRGPLGFAAELRPLRITRCRSIAQAVHAASGMRNVAQLCTNLLALAVSAVMVAALPDIRDVLAPPVAPMVVAPSSASPYELWVSLDTQRPEAFVVTLESEFWTNRRAAVAPALGPDIPPRAELSLRRLHRQTFSTEEEGTVWVARRHRFLGRELIPGERVGRYFLSYLFRLPHG
ncbi:MAG TPA: hypothetical protein VKA54_08520 [Gemmatimonadaceae bacterium]|nr:hypothetical protein [Gemmatimonadaceae bacterium]